MSDKIRVMFTEEEVNNKIKELGAQISADMNGEPVKIICMMTVVSSAIAAKYHVFLLSFIFF